MPQAALSYKSRASSSTMQQVWVECDHMHRVNNTASKIHVWLIGDHSSFADVPVMSIDCLNNFYNLASFTNSMVFSLLTVIRRSSHQSHLYLLASYYVRKWRNTKESSFTFLSQEPSELFLHGVLRQDNVVISRQINIALHFSLM